MLIEVGTLIPECHLRVEIGGVKQTMLLSINTETGEIVRYKLNESGLMVQGANGEVETETVVVPVEDLHIYLVKPK